MSWLQRCPACKAYTGVLWDGNRYFAKCLEDECHMRGPKRKTWHGAANAWNHLQWTRKRHAPTGDKQEVTK